MKKKILSKHKKHSSPHAPVGRVHMHGHGTGSNLKMKQPEQVVHAVPLYDNKGASPSRRNTEQNAGTSENAGNMNVFDSGDE